MILPSDVDSPVGRLLLEVTFQAEDAVSLDQHFGVDGAVGLVTHGASFPNRLMLEHEWAPLGNVASTAGFVLRSEGRAAADDRIGFV
jgi:hypothetical protein